MGEKESFSTHFLKLKSKKRSYYTTTMTKIFDTVSTQQYLHTHNVFMNRMYYISELYNDISTYNTEYLHTPNE